MNNTKNMQDCKFQLQAWTELNSQLCTKNNKKKYIWMEKLTEQTAVNICRHDSNCMNIAIFLSRWNESQDRQENRKDVCGW